jgi:glycosyltransferase involved in cell wall biosynthesis
LNTEHQGYKISVIVPGRNCTQFIEPLANSIKNQTYPAFEMLFIDDASTDNTQDLAEQYGFKVIRLTVNNGPGQARNKGVEVAQGDVVAFTDSDCTVTETWLENINRIIIEAPNEAIMGRTNIPKAGFWADCISDLGFPGGANLGFEKVWHVDKNGYTNHITSCNFALTKQLYLSSGGFDNRWSGSAWGTEDTELSRRWYSNGVKIHYRPEVHIWHIPRTTVKSFVQWHFRRGQHNYHYKRISGNSFGSFYKLRIWYAGNVIKTFWKSWRLPFILYLLVLSFVAQQAGFYKMKWGRSSP